MRGAQEHAQRGPLWIMSRSSELHFELILGIGSVKGTQITRNHVEADRSPSVYVLVVHSMAHDGVKFLRKLVDGCFGLHAMPKGISGPQVVCNDIQHGSAGHAPGVVYPAA